MKRIRSARRVDNLTNDVRVAKKTYGRHVYFAILAILVIQLLNYFFGDWVILRADGVVAREKISIDSAEISEVLSVMVTRGQTVSKGQPIMKINSNTLATEILELGIRKSNLENELTNNEAINRQPSISILNENIIEDTSLAENKSIVPKLATDLVEAEMNKSMINEEAVTKTNNTEIELINQRLQELSASYHGGNVLSPVDGEIGIEIRSAGEVLVPGETFLEIYYGKYYVYAYLPNIYKRSIYPGMEVQIRALNQNIKGHVSEVIPFAGVIPREFQNSVKAPGRHQIARIEFDEPMLLPLNQQVKVYRRDYWISSLFNF